MIISALALLALSTALAPTADDWLTQDMSARQVAREQAAPAFKKVMSHWKLCLLSKAKQLARSQDSADLVAVAALVKCSEWDEAIRIGLPAQIALANHSMPFLDSMKIAEENVDDHFKALKAGMKDRLLAAIISERSSPKSKR